MKFVQVNVFSKGTLGNPVACFLQPELSSEQMQQLANWMNLSETIFLFPSQVADYKIRIFTPTIELPFAGHPTVGSASAAIAFGLLNNKATFSVEVGGKVLAMRQADGKTYVETPDPETISIQKTIEDWSPVFSEPMPLHLPRIIDNGPKWLVMRAEHSDIHKITFDKAVLESLLVADGALGLALYSIHPNGHGTYENAKVVTRALFIDNGIVEDPICGSANACIAHHLGQSGLLESVGHSYFAFQGHSCARKGIVEVEVTDKVWIGGSAEIVLQGDYVI